MKSEFGVYIGRFQPFTIAHKAMVEIALEEADKVIIILGSDKASESLRNPFKTEERISMIYSVFADKRDRIIVLPMQDSAYNFTAWIAEVQRKINAIVPKESTVKLIGHFKDDTSYYLKHFPQWELKSIKSLCGGLSATEIRDEVFDEDNSSTAWKHSVPPEVDAFMCNWMTENSYRFGNLKAEYKFIQNYMKKWEMAPFKPVFVTTDAVVFSHSHILLIKRGRNPGIGQWALPGGFLEPDQTLIKNCIKELKEETKIDIARPILENSIKLKHEFDNPWRDPRGRTVTHAFKIDLNLKELPKVKAGDDASHAEWVPVGRLSEMEGMFFLDHLQIIKWFLGRAM